jgi:hypothetical protein
MDIVCTQIADPLPPIPPVYGYGFTQRYSNFYTPLVLMPHASLVTALLPDWRIDESSQVMILAATLVVPAGVTCCELASFYVR